MIRYDYIIQPFNATLVW